MNEILFIFHVLLAIAFGFTALRMGQAALTAWVALQAVLANLFVIKQIPFFGLHASCSDVFAIGSILGLNLMREYYGNEASKKALWTCVFSMVFFATMAQVHLFYQPSFFDFAHPSYEVILGSSTRLLAASLGTFFIVQQTDLRLFSLLKTRFPFMPLTVRSGLCLTSTQLLDTVLFTFFGLWGLAYQLFDIILVSFLVKLAVIACMSPLVHFSKRFSPAKV
jgi:uncharacterized integral membrane protein (TIGR00697 family)